MVPRYFAIFWRYRYHKSTDGTGTKKVPRYCPPMGIPKQFCVFCRKRETGNCDKDAEKKMKTLEEMIQEISADINKSQVANRLIIEKCVKFESKVKNKRLSISKYHGDREDLYKNLNELTKNFVIKEKGFLI